MQFIPCRVGLQNVPTLTFWDHGSTMGIITFNQAKVLKLHGWDVKQWVQVASKPWEVWETKIYLVPLVDRYGKVHQVKCFGADSITSKVEKVFIDGVIHCFPDYTIEQLARPYGEVQMLIGLNMLDIFPTGPTVRVDGLGVFESYFGTGFMLGGSHRSLKQSKVQ